VAKVSSARVLWLALTPAMTHALAHADPQSLAPPESPSLSQPRVPTRPQEPITRAYLETFDSQKTTVTLSNGQLLAYLDTGAHDAPPVVLIHGYTDSARDWAPVAPLLSAHLRLIIVDLRGHGASGKPDCCYTRFDFAYDIKLLLDSLHIHSADIVGHSLGSVVAQTFAERWPQATRRLILISSTGTSFGRDDSGCASTGATPLVQGWLAGIGQLRDPIDPDSPFMRDWWKESMSINPEFFSSRQRHDAAAIPAHVWRDIADQTLLGDDLRSTLPRIRAPTLLIWGGRDTVMSAAGRDALRNGIPQNEVRIFPILGHDLFWQDPRAVAAAMIRFLEKK
jgi:pimeloyl-ACP methyl ester carboxylesterase